jgi:hypothetical protein
MTPVISEIDEEYEYDPIPPRGVVRRKPSKPFEQELIYSDGEDLQEQSRKLGRYAAADIGNGIW